MQKRVSWLKRNKVECKKEKVLLSDHGSLYVNLDNPEVAKRLTSSLNFKLIEELRRAQSEAQRQDSERNSRSSNQSYDYTPDNTVKAS